MAILCVIHTLKYSFSLLCYHFDMYRAFLNLGSKINARNKDKNRVCCFDAVTIRDPELIICYLFVVCICVQFTLGKIVWNKQTLLLQLAAVIEAVWLVFELLKKSIEC